MPEGTFQASLFFLLWQEWVNLFLYIFLPVLTALLFSAVQHNFLARKDFYSKKYLQFCGIIQEVTFWYNFRLSARALLLTGVFSADASMRRGAETACREVAGERFFGADLLMTRDESYLHQWQERMWRIRRPGESGIVVLSVRECLKKYFYVVFMHQKNAPSSSGLYFCFCNGQCRMAECFYPDGSTRRRRPLSLSVSSLPDTDSFLYSP